MIKENKQSGVLIVLPVLNEVKNIRPLLEGIQHELQNFPYTVCIIDDGSLDGTVDILDEILVNGSHPIHLIQRKKLRYGSQRGSALRVGMEWGLQNSAHEIFVEMDGDLSHRPEDLKAGIRLVESEGYDVAIASKYVLGSQVINRTLGRNLVSQVCSMAVRLLINRQIKDYSNGYRFYTRHAAQVLSQCQIKHDSPIYLTEVLAIWLRNGVRIVEFPFVYVGRNEGLSKLRFTDLLKAAVAVLEIGWRYHVSGFNQRHETILVRSFQSTKSSASP